jgi:tetratricopeptide (TPR) repeat protein
MNMCSSLLVCLVAVLALSGCGAQSAPVSSRAAVSDPCAVALADGSRDDAEIGRLRERARSGVQSDVALEQLGFHYVHRARRSNDPGDYTLAEQVAACLEARQPGHANALLIRGHVLHQQHRFRDAEVLARRLVHTREFVLDYGLLGDVLMEQGKVSEAAAAYQRMIDIKPFYQSYIRAAHLRWLTGNTDGAIELARHAIAAASPRYPEAIAWAYTRLAHYELHAGRLPLAMNAANDALRVHPNYAAALLVRGRVHTATRELTEAVEDLEQAARLNPLPEYQWMLADALRAARQEEAAARVERELEATGARTDPRTLALYLATRRRDLPRALELTEREMAERADVFTLDARAWTLAAAGRLDDAHATMARALASGTRDARLYLHAASIAAAAGRREEAAQWAARAHATRFTLLPSELEELRHNPSINEEN